MPWGGLVLVMRGFMMSRGVLSCMHLIRVRVSPGHEGFYPMRRVIARSCLL